MKSFRIALIIAGGLALTLSLARSWNDRQELQKITVANDFLRKNLGEMAVAISAKDNEINRLRQSPCPSK